MENNKICWGCGQDEKQCGKIYNLEAIKGLCQKCFNHSQGCFAGKEQKLLNFVHNISSYAAENTSVENIWCRIYSLARYAYHIGEKDKECEIKRKIGKFFID